MIFKRYYNASKVIIDNLRKHTDIFFGYSGGANLTILNEVYNLSHNSKYKKLKFITSAHEQGAGHMAEAYGKITNGLGVVITTSGPGVTNLITPLQNALNDNNSLLVITGQVAESVMGTDSFQECKAVELTKPCTKYSYQLKNADEADHVIKYAIKLAKGHIDGRKGPVHIDIPKNIQGQNVKNVTKKVIKISGNNLGKNIDNQIKHVINVLNNSKKPILFVGKGCNNSYDELKQLAERFNIYVTTTLHGLGCFDETHPLSLKMVGMHGSVYSNYSVQEADCILCIGARFDDRTTGNLEKYSPNSIKIHVDIDNNRLIKIKKLINISLSIHSDSKNFIKNLLKASEEVNVNIDNKKEWSNKISLLKEKYNFSSLHSLLNKNSLTVPHVIDEINRQIDGIKDKVIITTGVGNHQMFTAQHINWKYPNKFITSGSLGVMGTGLPFAIGAKLAKFNNIVICIDGDSSFNMSSNELKTIIEHNIPIKIAIMNDNRQQMVWIWQKLFFNSNYISTTNVNPDYVKLAKAYKIKALKCSSLKELYKVKYFINYDKGPILCDFRVTPTMCTPLVPPGKGLDEMIIHETNNHKISNADVPS